MHRYVQHNHILATQTKRLENQNLLITGIASCVCISPVALLPTPSDIITKRQKRHKRQNKGSSEKKHIFLMSLALKGSFVHISVTVKQPSTLSWKKWSEQCEKNKFVNMNYSNT